MTHFAISLASDQLLIWDNILDSPFNTRTHLLRILTSFWKELKINSKDGKLICFPWQVD